MSTATCSPVAVGEEIYKLIPQRPPIVMVDVLFEVSETGAVTGLTVLQDNIFVERELCGGLQGGSKCGGLQGGSKCGGLQGGSECGGQQGQDGASKAGGRLSESGVIEHVAQSAAVFNGYWAVVRGLTPSLGYIAEIKKFSIVALPPVGSQLRTEIKVQNSFGGMMLLSAQVLCKVQGEESNPPFAQASSRTGGIVPDDAEARKEAGSLTDGMVQDGVRAQNEKPVQDGASDDGWQVIAAGQMKLFMDSKE